LENTFCPIEKPWFCWENRKNHTVESQWLLLHRLAVLHVPGIFPMIHPRRWDRRMNRTAGNTTVRRQQASGG
jgi:hypothetical protein